MSDAIFCTRCKAPIGPDEPTVRFNRPVPNSIYHKVCPGMPQPAPSSDTDTLAATLAAALRSHTAGVDVEQVRDIATDVLAERVDAITQTVLNTVLAASEKLPTVAEIAEMVNKAVDARARIIKIEMPDGTQRQADGFVHASFDEVVAHAEVRSNLYLYGPPGGGKSYAAKQLADMLGLQFGYVSLTSQTLESRLMGAPTVDGRTTRTAFRECYEHGGVFCIDELDNASANLLTALNAALANGHCAFPDALIEKHADFILVCGGNTRMRGGDPAFPERRVIDAATIDRFVYIYWPIDAGLERSIALSHNADAGPWVEWIQALRAWAAINDPKLVVSPRCTYTIATMLRQGKLPLDKVLNSALWKGIEQRRIDAALTANPHPRG